MKDFIRKVLIFFRLDITQNLKYDRLTKKIMKNNLSKDSNCIDVGCHKGEILDLMLLYAPQGKHTAFEPIPNMFTNLKEKYASKVNVFPFALSDFHGKTSFQWVKNAPAYSGIKKRMYAISNPEIEELEVEVRLLDDVVSSDHRIHFVKIDVEGGEFGVFKGAQSLLSENKPIILFECGKGASDYYGTKPLEIYNFITQNIGLSIYTLERFCKKASPLSLDEFESVYESNKEYYFVASVKQ